MSGHRYVHYNREDTTRVLPRAVAAFAFALSIIALVFFGRPFTLPDKQSSFKPTPAIHHSVNHATGLKGDPGDASGKKIEFKSRLKPAKGNIARSAQTAITPAQQLIDELLWLLDQPYSTATASQFQFLLAQLADQGDAAVPAIREFLMSGADQSLAAEVTLRHSSFRLALIDTLHKAVSEQAQSVSLELLRTEISAQEFVALSGYLEKQDPGFYQAEIELAGRRLLARASDLDNVELGPVYQLLGEAGATSVAELSQTPPHLKHYASVSLALLPDGKGVPALLDELWQSDLTFNNQQDRLKLKLLAQVAAEQPEAAAMLAELVSLDLIPDRLWPEIAAIAAGLEQIRLSDNGGAVVSRHQISSAFGDQVVYRSRAHGPYDAAEALARLQLIENLYRVAAGDAANQALVSVFDRLPVRYQGFFRRQEN
jgi:hypothetical protein